MRQRTTTNRVAEVNAALKARGRGERLRRGAGYYYFSDGETGRWRATSVYVYRADSLTVAEWLHEFDELQRDSW